MSRFSMIGSIPVLPQITQLCIRRDTVPYAHGLGGLCLQCSGIAPHLQCMSNLQRLDISDAVFEGFQFLAGAILHLVSLTDVRITHNYPDINDHAEDAYSQWQKLKDADVVALCETLACLKGL